MVWGLVVGSLILLVGCRRRVWRSRGRFPTTAPPPVPAAFPAQSDGCWYEARATLWFSHAGPLRRQGDGTLRCLGDQLQWLGRHGTIWVEWRGILAIHGHPNGLLIHTTELPPFVVSVADNAVLHSVLTAWLARDWVLDGHQWIRKDLI